MPFGFGRSFADTYNLRRQEGIKAVVALPKIVLSSRDWGPLSARGCADQGPSDRGTYRLIRSDLEEVRATRELPEMPQNAGTLRSRASGWRAVTLNYQPAVVDHGANSSWVWVESGVFQGFSGAMICVNAALIGLETEIETPAWFWVEQFLLTFFLFELVAHMNRHKWNFFKHPDDWVWNFFDFFIVISGVCDQWVFPAAKIVAAHASGVKHHAAPSGRVSMFFMLMRMLRLLRIVRLFRLVRIVRPLYELAQGVMEAIQGMFWVLIFLLMTLYAVAILCTRLVGHGDMLPEDADVDGDLAVIIDMFATVGDSMFTLFGTMSSWSLLKFVPLFGEMPLLKPIFVVFYVYSAWALLAVMTGVVSENMIVIREQMVKEDELREEMRKSMVTKLLLELFQNADADHSGTVSKAEFEMMLRSPDLARKIEQNTHLKIKDLEELFDWLDHDRSGTITIDEFMVGFKWVNEPLRAKSLVKLQERLASDLKCLETNVTAVFETRAMEVQKLVAAPLQKIHAITEQMQTMDVHFGTIRTGVKDVGMAAPTPQDLRDTEVRLGRKMSAVLRRLEEIEEKAASVPQFMSRTSVSSLM